MRLRKDKYALWAVLILTSLVFSSFISHKFYVSLTEIRVNEKNNTIEISMRIFPDDLDKAIEAIEGVNPQILMEQEQEVADKWIAEYVGERFTLQINDKEIEYTYLGKEAESDAVWCYFEAEFRGTPKKVEITHSLLTDIYSEQVNIVQFYYNDFNKGILLNRERSTGVIEIKAKKRSRK